MKNQIHGLLIVLLLTVFFITGGSMALAQDSVEKLAPEQEAFWSMLFHHCGQAYRGEVTNVTQYYKDVVIDREFVLHFFDCSDDRIHIAFHIDDERSRNWIITPVDGTLRLAHIHRYSDGSEEDFSRYGGKAPVPGLSTRQIFWADEHTAELAPEREDNFWYLEFVNGEVLQYGVIWPAHGHALRFDFDLTQPVEAPPAPWGY